MILHVACTKTKKNSLFFYRTVLLKCPYFVSFLLVSFNALSILLDAFGQIQAHVNGFFSASYWCVCTCFYSERCIFRYVCIITRTRMTRIKNIKPTAHMKCTSIKKKINVKYAVSAVPVELLNKAIRMKSQPRKKK